MQDRERATAAKKKKKVFLFRLPISRARMGKRQFRGLFLLVAEWSKFYKFATNQRMPRPPFLPIK